MKYPSRERSVERYRFEEPLPWKRRTVNPRCTLLDEFVHCLRPMPIPRVEARDLIEKFKPAVVWGPDPPVVVFSIKMARGGRFDVGEETFDLNLHAIWDGEYGKGMIDDERVTLWVRNGEVVNVRANYGHFEEDDRDVQGEDYVIFFYQMPGHNPEVYLTRDPQLQPIEQKYGQRERDYVYVIFEFDENYYVKPVSWLEKVESLNIYSQSFGWKYPETWYLLLKRSMLETSLKTGAALPKKKSLNDFARFTLRANPYLVGDRRLDANDVRYL